MACESEKVEREAGKLLLSLGGTPNYYGFRYTVYGVALVIREEAYLLALTKRLYPDIARYYQTTREAVERSIRTLISVMWDKNPELFWELFGYPRWWKPSAGELIAAMSQYIKVRE